MTSSPSAKRKADEKILTRDKDLGFPEFVLLKASAGSGKTHALSLRFVQFLLSEDIHRKTPADLRNILAITFTKNAAKEMKDRILSWLKACVFGDKKKTKEILGIVSLHPKTLALKAEAALDDILSRYTDFQVATIDSFMASVFKASTLDLGYSPSFDIVLDNSEMVEYAFSRYLRKITPQSKDGAVFRKIVDLLMSSRQTEASFLWEPASSILEKLKILYVKLAGRREEPDMADFEGRREDIQKRIKRQVHRVRKLIDSTGLEISSKATFSTLIEPAVSSGSYPDLAKAAMKTPPVKKPSAAALTPDYEAAIDAWEQLKTLVDEYRYVYAGGFYYPYLRAWSSLSVTLDKFKRQKETVFIEDIHKKLSNYINQGIVPDIYFRLGDRILHYLIDEFQDTSPIQWSNILPLVENSLALNGSLFIVGDTKQAIYGFRDADFRIMKGLEDGAVIPFLSAEVQVKELTKNFRSRAEIVGFAKRLFLERMKSDECKKYHKTGKLSGLTAFHQEPADPREGEGHVEISILEKVKEKPGESGIAENAGVEAQDGAADLDEGHIPEKRKVQELVRELKARGYAYSDIAILAYKNQTVVDVSSWLNEIDVPFIPFSCLDIRLRKITGEIVALLRFLDSPPDDLSFSVVMLGEMLRRKIEQDGTAASPALWHEFLFHCRRSKDRPVYVAFRKSHPELWARYFDVFFRRAGYLPLYDLVTLIYRVFNVFDLFPGEEAALVKFMESIKDFESRGRNDLREFIESSSRLETPDPAWNIDVPSDIDAVRIMSIHKAKGLGFPVVILLLYGERFHPEDFYLGPEGEPVRIYKLTKELAEAHEELRKVYRDARSRDEVDRLNALYVAVTRAKSELYIVGVKAARDGYPFDLIAEGYVGAKPVVSRKPERSESPPAEKRRLAEVREPAPSPRTSLHFEGIRRGAIAHEILARMTYVREGWEKELQRIIQESLPGKEERGAYESVGRAISEYFLSAPLGKFFQDKDGRRVLTEVNFCDARGNVYRPDRVILDRDAVTIMDFKTGFAADRRAAAAAWEHEDRDQMNSYIRIIRDIYPGKPVRGIIAHIDQKSWETLE